MNAKKSMCGPAADSTIYTRISRLVAVNQSVGEVLQVIMEEAGRVCDAVRGFLAIVDHDRGELDVRYTAGSGWTEEKRIGRLKVSEETGRGITSHVAATGKAYMSPNVLEDPYYILAFDDVRSEIAVPLLDNYGRTRGVINLESIELDHFNEDDLCTVLGLADLAMIAITMAEHRAREAALVQVGKELNSFHGVDIILQKVIDVTADALKFEDCSLFLLDRVSGRLVLRASRGSLSKKINQASYEVGEGLTGWTAQQQQVVRLVDPCNDPRWKGRFQELPAGETGAFMAVPIRSRSGIIGVLRLQRRRSPYKWFTNEFTEDDERILTTIAGQVGIALDNARLVFDLVRAERMAAWGEMSARSAHMIGNRVFAIKGDINELEYLMQGDSLDRKEILELCQSTKKGIFMLEELLNEFREFVKATQLDFEEVDLNRLVRESIDEGFPKRSHTNLKVELKPDLPVIKADPRKLKRCFGEIMENAVNFQPDGGEILIKTGLADHRSRQWLRPEQQSENFVQVVFEDKGPGVPSEHKPKIFNPFYTSRAKGMGLGLSIVKGIVDAHHGTIFESGKPGKGAKFTILLPY